MKHILTTLILSVSALTFSASAQEKFTISDLAIKGDTAFLKGASIDAELQQALTQAPVTEQQILDAIKAANKRLITKGYYLALITPDFDAIGDGKLTLQIDQGRVGKVSYYRLPDAYENIYAEDRPKKRAPYDGYFSTSQLNQRLASLEPANPFNYLSLHQELFALNAHPDLVMHTDMRIREENELRYVDLDFYVEDRAPLHYAFTLKNTGTPDTDEERLLVSIQHLNVTKNDDALTIALSSSLDLETLRGISASYLIPHEMGLGGGLSVLAGYAELDADILFGDFRTTGESSYVGARYFHRLVDAPSYGLNATFGIQYSDQADELILQGTPIQNTDIELLPATLGLVYFARELDGAKGRNFITGMVTHNLGDAAGISDEAQMRSQRPDANADYTYGHLEASRIQVVGGEKDLASGEYDGAWYVFLSGDVRYSSDALIPAEQLPIGGFETVRGYPERIAAGDRTYMARAELRTPIYRGLYTRFSNRNKTFEERANALPVDYMQFSTFVDAGRIELNSQDEAGESLPDTDLLGVGLGLRLSFGKFSQVKVDYGWPLEDHPGVDTSGRLHFSIEAQY